MSQSARGRMLAALFGRPDARSVAATRAELAVIWQALTVGARRERRLQVVR